MYIIKKNNALPTYVNSLAQGGILQGIPQPLIQLSHLGRTLTGRCRVVRLCSLEPKFQMSSANTTQTIWELFAQYWGQLQPNISLRLYIRQHLTLTNS